MTSPEDHRKERELARQFMREILVPESENSSTLKFIDDWEENAESFIRSAKDSYDQESITALLAILVNASKALVDQVVQDPSSPLRNVADDLFSYIRVAAPKYSPQLREAVEERRDKSLQQRKKAAFKLLGISDSHHGHWLRRKEKIT